MMRQSQFRVEERMNWCHRRVTRFVVKGWNPFATVEQAHIWCVYKSVSLYRLQLVASANQGILSCFFYCIVLCCYYHTSLQYLYFQNIIQALTHTWSHLVFGFDTEALVQRYPPDSRRLSSWCHRLGRINGESATNGSKRNTRGNKREKSGPGEPVRGRRRMWRRTRWNRRLGRLVSSTDTQMNGRRHRSLARSVREEHVKGATWSLNWKNISQPHTSAQIFSINFNQLSIHRKPLKMSLDAMLLSPLFVILHVCQEQKKVQWIFFTLHCLRRQSFGRAFKNLFLRQPSGAEWIFPAHLRFFL